MGRWFRRLLYLLRQSRHERELREEIEAHRVLRQASLERQGLTASDADAASRRAIGDVLLAREEAREAWLGSWDTWWQDVRYAGRMIRRSPGVAAIVILTMAVGVGMNAAMLGVFHAVIVRPLAYPDPERLVWLTNYSDRFNHDNSGSRGDFLVWRARAQAFERMAAYGERDLAVGVGDDTREERVASISEDFWAITGAHAVTGRLFAPDEQEAIVLSHEIFERRFGADPGVIGRVITLNGAPATVVGVLATDYQFAFPRLFGDMRRPSAYVVLPNTPTQPGRPDISVPGRVPVPTWIRVVGKLRPGVALSQARSEMQVIYDQNAREHPTPLRQAVSLRVQSLQERIVGPVEWALTILLVAVAFVLLIATTNIAHLMLARSLSRQTEMAVRLSLGAGRARVIRQVLSESVLLAAIGGAAGLVLAQWTLSAIVRSWPQAIPRLEGANINGWVLTFALAATLVSTVLFGAVPALALLKTDLTTALKREDRSASSSRGVTRVRGLLVSLELALATVLLIGAGLMIKSFWLMTSGPPGLEPERILVARVSMSGPRYANRIPQEQYVGEVLQRLENTAGVAAAGLDAGSFHFAINVDGVGPAFAALKPVSFGFLRVMNVPLLRGSWPTARALASDSVESTDALLVNKRFVDGVMRGADPIGRRISGPYLSGTIAGVVADFKDRQLDAEPLPQVYIPFKRAMVLRSVQVVLRMQEDRDPYAAAPVLRDAINQIDRTQAAAEFSTLEDVLASSVANRRFNLSLLSLFAGVALFLALTGAYGVIAHSVARRTREIGIRIALGARPTDVVRLVVRHEMRVALVGIAVGLLATIALAPIMASLVYGVAPRDPITFIVVGAALALASLITSWSAAARAARVDPIIVLQA